MRRSVVIAALLCSSGNALAQGVIKTLDGITAEWMQDAGDIDGDGSSDLLVTNHVGTGSLSIISTVSGQTIYHYDNPGNYGAIGVPAAALGDVNGDGVPDYSGSFFNFRGPFGNTLGGSAMVWS